MVMNGHAWSCMVICGYVWPFMDFCGHVYSSLFMYGHAWSIWLCMIMVMYCHIQCIVKYGLLWSCLAMYDFVRLCKVQSRKYWENRK